MSKKINRDKGIASSKLDSNLRMYSNGNFDVNRIRAELKGNIAVDKQVPIPEKICRSIEQKPARTPVMAPKFKKGDLDKEVLPDQILTNVFIEVKNPDDKNSKAVQHVLNSSESLQKGNLIIAQVPITTLQDIADDENVLSVQSSESLAPPRPSTAITSATSPSEGHRLPPISVPHNGGANILIGIIDVGGFDFAHPDFCYAKGKKTRFVRIWDQDGEGRDGPNRFGFGAEFKKEHLDRALKTAPKIKVSPHAIEKQSQMIEGSHGTHVASIAAGNTGVCPKAAIAGVLIALTEEDTDRRKSFFDSSRIAMAVEYLLDLAKELKKDAVSINISLGTNGHSHDGSAPINRWLDVELSKPGRCISVAAGNAGQDQPQDENDLGHIMGRIHTSGRIEASGLVKDITLRVVGDGLMDVSENELEIWYGAQDRFSILVKPPGMDWIGPVQPRQFIENQQLVDGSFISVYNELFHPANGSNYIGVFLSPNLNDNAIIGVPAGVWKIRLVGEEIRDGHYHGWIERDDPRPLGRVGEEQIWNFPSFFTPESNVDSHSVNSLACGHNIISVGNYDLASEQMNISSSQGPTRDGRSKPEIIAPGTVISAAKGFASNEDLWTAKSGTSMASPYICGVAGLMLSIEPNLTAAQIAGIVMRTSFPIPGNNYRWKGDAGFGVIRPDACLKETKTIFERKDVTTKKLQG